MTEPHVSDRAVVTTDLLAILVTDLVDSTATRSRLGEERADSLQHLHDEILKNAVTASHGQVVKGTGDGVIATFGSATDALATAVAIQQQLDAYSCSANAIAPLAARVGISVGDVVHQDDDIFGSALIEAARLAAAAQAGQILCSELVRTLARGRGGFEFEILGLLELKGLLEPIATCLVRWDRVDTGPALALPDELVGATRDDFVGRDAELREVVGVALGSDAATARWVLGEPGMGKTRFAAEVAVRVHEAGAVVLYGRCDELVPDPFQPFIQALRGFVAGMGADALDSSLGADPGPLVRLVPEIGSHMPQLLNEVGRTTEGEQFRLFESVRSWLATAVPGRPIVLVVDDVHWADRPTLAMLAHVIRSAAPARLCVIGTARNTTPDASELLAEIVDDLARTGRTSSIQLAGLNTAQVAALMHGAVPDLPDTNKVAARIADETAGNPLFVTALLAGLRSGASSDAGDLPVDVTAAVRNRVHRLSEDTQAVLQVAALTGLEFSLAVVAGACNMSETSCLERVEQAVDAALVDEIDLDRFRFMHALVRDALEAELSISRRARLHGTLAETIERRYASDLSDHLRALARHCAQARTPELTARSIEYARRSARRAIEQLAFDVAADDYAFALESLDRLGHAPARTRYELMIGRGDAQIMAALNRSAVDSYGGAAEVARQLEDWEAFARAAIGFEQATWRPGLVGERAAALLGEANKHDLQTETLVLVKSALGRALQFSGDFVASQKIAAEALDEARSFGSPALLVRALEAFATTVPMVRHEDIELLVAIGREITDIAEHHDMGELEGLTLAHAVYTHIDDGNIDAARRWIQRAERLITQSGFRFDRYLLMSIRQILTFCDGDLDSAEMQANELLEFGNTLGEDVSGTHGVQLFLIRREQGRLPELAPIVRTVLQLNPTDAMWRPGLIDLLAEAGMLDEARELLEEYAVDEFARLPRDAMFAASLCLLSEAAARVGSTDAARTLTALLSPWDTRGVWIGPTVGFVGSADRYLGLLASIDGRIDDADKHFTDALDLHRRLEMPVWIAHSLADRAVFLSELGHRERSRPLVTEARYLAERHELAAIMAQLDLIA